MYESRYKLLKIAFERFLRAEPDDFEAFCEKEADWLSDYALFMALKDANGGNAWFSWEKRFKDENRRHLPRREAPMRRISAFIRCYSICFSSSGGS